MKYNNQNMEQFIDHTYGDTYQKIILQKRYVR